MSTKRKNSEHNGTCAHDDHSGELIELIDLDEEEKIQPKSATKKQKKKFDNGEHNVGESLVNHLSNFILASDKYGSGTSVCTGAVTPEAHKISLSLTRQSVERTIPLLRSGSTVPFLCRYRREVVYPLSVSQVHSLRDLLEKHESLKALRNRAIRALDNAFASTSGSACSSSFSSNRWKTSNERSSMLPKGGEWQRTREKMLTSIDRSELEELYGPFKPPSKGSIAERIAVSYPDIVSGVDKIWNIATTTEHGGIGSESDSDVFTLTHCLLCNKNQYGRCNRDIRRTKGKKVSETDLTPREAVVHCLANKVASSTAVSDVVLGIARKEILLQVSHVKKKSSSSNAKDTKKASNYKQYFDFSTRLRHLKDHQILAIRRGCTEKYLKSTLTFSDQDYVKRCIRRTLFDTILVSSKSFRRAGTPLTQLLNDSVDDAWVRLLKRRCLSSVWRERVSDAEARGIRVFADNVRTALMTPPQTLPTYVLAVDPGYRAGCKVALLNPLGSVLNHPKSLCTVKFLGREEEAVSALVELMAILRAEEDGQRISSPCLSFSRSFTVALGNGHGSEKARELLQKAASRLCHISLNLEIVNEAGASVWSVSPSADKEFPNVEPALRSAVSLGRRLQDPMNELVKIPPRSLGLGMYQHDLPEEELGQKLQHATIDAVALVGVDVNSCSLELLRNVPGLSRGHLAEDIIRHRPFSSREDLKLIRGIGPKAFENCAAFVRIRREDTKEVLDSTRVHPESYPLARWLLSKCRCKTIGELADYETMKNSDEKTRLLVSTAAARHGLSTSRVEEVIASLLDAARGVVDPRLIFNHEESAQTSPPTNMKAAVAKECPAAHVGENKPVPLPRHLVSNFDALRDACPLTNIQGTVRNVTDFGAFVDYGGHRDGLLHVSKMGPLKLEGIYSGSRIGVDILGGSSNCVLFPPRCSKNIPVFPQCVPHFVVMANFSFLCRFSFFVGPCIENGASQLIAKKDVSADGERVSLSRSGSLCCKRIKEQTRTLSSEMYDKSHKRRRRLCK